MQETTGGTATGRRRMTPYLATWILLAVLAGSYIALAALRPELLTSAGNDKPLQAPSETNHGQRATTAAGNDALQMQRDILALKQKLAQAQDEARLRAAEEEKYKRRVAELETASTTPASATPETNTATTAAADAAAPAASLTTKVLNAGEAPAKDMSEAKKTTKNTTTIAKAAQQPKSDQPAKIIAEPEPKKLAEPKKTPEKPKIETASVNPAPAVIDFGPAVVTPAAKPIGVRLATGPSVDSLRLSWSALADRHGPTLQNLQPRYMTGIGATGLTYDLVAGPMSTEAEAQALCQRLASSGVRCSIGEYTGNAL